MVSINYASREVNCKIVYYGPGLSGKTTNLIYVHKKVPATTKGKMISLATEADRTLYFDFLPINIGKINGFSAKFQLYTVPGQVYYNATRKLVLRGVDGIVFVADSQADKMDENIESITNMIENLAEYGYDINDIPIVLQYNKRDLPGALPKAELDAKLNPNGWISFDAEAVNGPGVFDTLKMIIKLVLEKAKNTRSSAKPAAPPKPQAASVPPSPPPPLQAAAEPVNPAVPYHAAEERELPDEPLVETPEEVPGLVRREAYDAIPQSEAAQAPPVHKEPSPAGPPQSEVEEVGVNAGGTSTHRPFPGSNTARIARRERRITVSDFQPASREEENQVLPAQMSEQEPEEKKILSDMPTPRMAPSQRAVAKKKRGFFKRLFGIK